ncbi:MAG TPA: serine/threonine-protein kinase [Actinomycetota bacterium]|nr:serine/threonine-protein kinase [Actinomycetota bacterium]
MQKHDVIQERYDLDHPLGQGGMAEVWCARDRRLERSVAVKFLAPQFHEDAEFLVRFFSEAQSVAQISHPNVVAVLDFGEHDGRPYLVMEYVGGGSVADLTGDPLLPERACEIVRDAAKGAGAAHAVGLVHRDIKPANILLTPEGIGKLADFGIASSRGGERLTATGQAIGSPHYLSPEQASGAGCTPRSDVYSLGVVLYQLLTGRPPFDAENITAIAIAHVDETPRPPSALAPDIDPALEELVLRCLAKDPEQRYPEGTALAIALDDPYEAAALFPTDFEADLNDEPTLGRRVLTGVLTVVLVLALLGVGVWAAVRPDGDERPQSYDQETVDRGVDPVRRRPRPDPTPTGSTDVAVPVTEVAPSPTETPEEDRPERDRDRSGGGGSFEPEPEPTTEPSPEPTSEPSPEPTTEPTPAPTSQDTSEDTSEGTNPRRGS